MHKHYLWVRAWPWFFPSFPFARFDDIEDAALWPALQAFAREWDDANPGRVEAERRRQVKQSAQRASGLLTSSTSREPRRTVTDDQFRTPGSFAEVSVLAGWTSPLRGLVHNAPGKSAYHPTPRAYFLALDDGAFADEILDALRKLRPFVDSRDFGSSKTALLRYGKTAEDAPKATRLGYALAFENFEASAIHRRSWSSYVASEAVRIARLLGETARSEAPAAPGVAEPKPMPKPVRDALASYELAYETIADELTDGGRHYSAVYRALRRVVERGECAAYPTLQDLPTFETWERKARAGLNDGVTGRSESDDDPRDHGSSVAEAEKL